MRKAVIAALSITFLHGLCAAAPWANPKAIAALQSALPGKSLVDDDSIAFGDLDGDGIEDFAALVKGGEAANDAGDPLTQIAVLRGTKGGFILLGLSRDVYQHPRVELSVAVDKNTLSLFRAGSGGCCSHWREQFKFAVREGKLLLVGVETSEYAVGDVEEGSGSSVNLRTGKRLEWQIRGKRRTESTFDLSIPPVTLDTFDYSEFSRRLRNER